MFTNSQFFWTLVLDCYLFIEIIKGKENIIIQIIWIPSHNDITGNERADKLAKDAIVSPNAIPCQVYSISDIKQIMKKKKLSTYGKMNEKCLTLN